MSWLNLNQKDFLKFMLENKKSQAENIIEKIKILLSNAGLRELLRLELTPGN